MKTLEQFIRHLREADWSKWGDDINTDAYEYGFKLHGVQDHGDGHTTSVFKHPQKGHILKVNAGPTPEDNHWTMHNEDGLVLAQSHPDPEHNDSLFLDPAAEKFGLKHRQLMGGGTPLPWWGGFQGFAHEAVVRVAGGQNVMRVLESVMTTIHHDFYGNLAGLKAGTINRIPVCPECNFPVKEGRCRCGIHTEGENRSLSSRRMTLSISIV